MNRFLGSILIIAGTTIGAGMLALPIATSGVGFLTSIIILVVIWIFMAYTALLLAEVYRYNSPQLGFDSLCEKYLGVYGKWIARICILFLMYALIAAYISGAGELLSNFLNNIFERKIPTQIGIIIFTIVGGLIVAIGTKMVDGANRILFTLKMLFFCLSVIFLMPYVKYEFLLSLPIEQGLVLSAIPIIFTSFGFHGSIPTIVAYMNGDVKKIKRIFLVGSAIPLIVYILWQVATMGTLGESSFLSILHEKSGLTGLLNALNTTVHNKYVEFFMHSFADIALGTSFLGVSLGMFDYITDLFKTNKKGKKGKFKVSLICFIPPICFALFYPKGFVLALGYASIALVFIALVIPSFLFFAIRKNIKESANKKIINNAMIALVLLFGVGSIAIQILVSIGKLPNVG